MHPIFIVDDCSELLEVYREFFQDDDLEIFYYNSRAQALDAMERGIIPALVFVDFLMRGISLPDFLARMRSIAGREPRVLIMSFSGVVATAKKLPVELRERCREKPLSCERLRELVQLEISVLQSSKGW